MHTILQPVSGISIVKSIIIIIIILFISLALKGIIRFITQKARPVQGAYL